MINRYTPEQKEEIYKTFAGANYFWVAISMVAGILAHISRAVRWKMLFMSLGFVPRLSNTFHAVMVGYFGNILFPRAGEVLRCGIIKGYEKIPLTQSIGTVISERIVDLFILFILLVFSVWREYGRLHNYISENITGPMKIKLTLFFENKFMLLTSISGIVALVAFLYIFRRKTTKYSFVQKIRNVLHDFFEGMRSVVKVKSFLWFAFHSVFIWIMYLLSVYVCVFAFTGTEPLSITDCVVLMAFGSLGVIAVQGGIGAYQWIVLQIMLAWGYSETIGFAFGLMVWAAQTLVIIIGGPISFGLLSIGKRK